MKKSQREWLLFPAPAKAIKEELLKVTDIIVPNETEAELITGIKVESIEDAERAGKVFLEKGVKFAIITLGSRGTAVIGADFCELVPAYKVNAIDAIEKGEMKATVAQQPDLIGALGVEITEKIYNGEAIEKLIAADLKIISK